jgi:CXXX repeat peptide maturase
VVASGKHALVILDKGAVPFCYYENPHFYSQSEPQWMPAALLTRIVGYARKKQIALTFLLGKTRPPAQIERLIASHAKIVPPPLHAVYPDAVLVLDAEERGSFAALTRTQDRNVILRVSAPKGCSDLVESLLGKFKRLSLHLVGQEYFGAAELAAYERELGKISRLLAEQFREGETLEFNVLTDRMMLTAMRNCGAGTDHLTIAPNGKSYICPGFYYDNEADFVGIFDDKTGFAAGTVRGTELSRAPLCSRCDAFHCKRCIYLNRKTTLELNIPSEQQCAISHAEREASRQLLTGLGSLEPFRRMPRIPELNYRDPLECIDAPPRDVGQRATDPSTDPML